MSVYWTTFGTTRAWDMLPVLVVPTGLSIRHCIANSDARFRAGSCYSVGLGGHICGGGYGLLSRLNGLTVDYLTGVEMVTVRNGKPELTTVTEDSTGDDYDLYWASLGGGGGNFGLITNYYFKTLPKAPKYAMINTIGINWSEITSPVVLQRILDVFAEFAVFWPCEVYALLKLMHVSAKQVAVVTQVVYDDPAQQQHLYDKNIKPFLKALRKVVNTCGLSTPLVGHPVSTAMPISEHTQPLTWYEAAQTLNGSGVNQRFKNKSAYMRKPFPPHQTEALYKFLKMTPGEVVAQPGLDCIASGCDRQRLADAVKKGAPAIDFSHSLLQVDSYGGKVNTVSKTATVIPQRDSIMKLQYQTYWQNYLENSQEEHFIKDVIHRLWIFAMYQEVYSRTGGTPNPYLDPDDVVDGCYYNYPDTDLIRVVGLDTTLKLNFQGNYEDNARNLVGVKKEWDPNNYFHHAMSIPVK